jgi:tetratricopeptide (TPR) repeat protein
MGTLDRALALAKRGVALDPDEPDCHRFLGWVYLFRRSFDLAVHCFRRALELNPNSAEHTSRMGDLNCFLGNPEEALGWFEKARQLNPYYDNAQMFRMQGIAHFTANRVQEAIACFRRSPAMPYWVWGYLAACHALESDHEQAANCKSQIMAIAPDFSLNRFAAKEPLRRHEHAERLILGMRKAGLPE